MDILEELNERLKYYKLIGVDYLDCKNREEAKADEMEQLKESVLKCTECSLCETRNNVVFGSGNPDARLMFVGEAPGRDEDLKGEPFVGRAGQLLTKIIEAIGMTRDDVYISNIVKCRPPENRNPEKSEILACRSYIEKQIELISPEVIVTLGSFASLTLLNINTPISKIRGNFRDYKGVALMPTFHPAFLLRNPSSKREVWIDMQKVRDRLK